MTNSRIIKIDEARLRSIVRTTLNEVMDELNLYHGTNADFDNFDVAYMSTGWGQQAHGYGFYLTDCYEAAKDYSCGGKVMEVKVPDGKYLSDKRISPREKQVIAHTFFKYYTEELDYGKEAYPDAQARNEFWQYEVSCILNCDDGAYVYGTVASLLGSNEDASNFLHDKLGYVGITIHTKHGETGEPITTYVIFNPNDIEILNKNVVNEEIDKYQSGEVANKNAHDISIGKFSMFRLGGPILSCIYEAAFQLLGFERFGINGEIIYDNKVMDNPWDDANAILDWAVKHRGLDKKYLSRVSSLYSGMSEDEFKTYCEQVQNGKRILFSRKELAEINKYLPDKLREDLVKDMANVGRIGKVQEMVEYLKNYNGGQNLEEFIQIMKQKYRNGEIQRGSIGDLSEPVRQAMVSSRMIGSGE